MFNGQTVIYSHYTIKGTGLFVNIAGVLSPRDIVLFGKWNSVRVRYIFGHYILKAKSNFTL